MSDRMGLANGIWGHTVDATAVSVPTTTLPSRPAPAVTPQGTVSEGNTEQYTAYAVHEVDFQPPVPTQATFAATATTATAKDVVLAGEVAKGAALSGAGMPCMPTTFCSSEALPHSLWLHDGTDFTTGHLQQVRVQQPCCVTNSCSLAQQQGMACIPELLLVLASTAAA